MKKPFTWIFFEEKMKYLQRALKLQAKEYEKIVDELRKEILMLTEWKTKQEGRS